MSELSKEYKAAKATYDSWPQWKRDYADQWMRPQKEPEPSYPEAVDGDIYLNPFFGDMWIVDDKHFIKINDGYSMELDEPEGFIKVGHVDGVINKKNCGKIGSYVDCIDGYLSDEEQKTYRDILKKNSIDTGINIFDLFED